MNRGEPESPDLTGSRLGTRKSVARRDRLMVAGVMAVTLLVYLRSLGNGFVFDDEGIIVENRYLERWSFIWKSLFNDLWWFADPAHLPQTAHYRPLVGVWFGFNYQAFGLHAAGWHLATLALHLVVVGLVFKLTAHLTRDTGVAQLACLLFGLLPVHDQAVVWASGISLLLSTTLELGAFYLFVTRAAGRARLAAASALYAGAPLCHESAVIFPALVGLYVFLLEAPRDGIATTTSAGGVGSRLRRAAVEALPFAGVVILYMAARRLVLGFLFNGPFHAGHAGLAQVLMTVPRVILTDLVLLAIPSTTGFTHRQLIVTNPGSPDFVTGLMTPDFWVPVVALIALVAALLWSIRNSPRRRLYLFCAAWMGIAIAPMMNVGAIVKSLLVQDDYLYMASVGWCVMVADCVVRRARDADLTGRNLIRAAALVVLLIYASALWRTERLWHDDLTLFTRCLEQFPESSVCHRQVGIVLKQSHDLGKAERELAQAVRLDPDDADALDELAKTHALQGKVGDATREMARAVEMEQRPKTGDLALLAQLYDLNGDAAHSEGILRHIESMPDGAPIAGVARGQMKIARGDAASAEAIVRPLAGRYPDNYRLWTLLGLALAAQNHNEQALRAFQRALAVAPPDPAPHFFAARLLHQMGRDREALTQCRMALAAAPDDGSAKALMAEISGGKRSQ
jgi:Flp pilus assembly protein TadD